MKYGSKALSLFLLASQDVRSSSAFRPSALGNSSKSAFGVSNRRTSAAAASTASIGGQCERRQPFSVAAAMANRGSVQRKSAFQHALWLSTRGGASSSSSPSSSSALNSAVADTAESTAPVEIFRKDYQPLPHIVSKIHMDFDIQDGVTTVTSKLFIEPNPDVSPDLSTQDMVLDGDETCVKLLKLSMNSKDLVEGTDYTLAPGKLILKAPPPGSVLTTVVELTPEANTQLSGLYKSGPMYCTQCEAMGFRRITYYPDRPDNMAIFESVRLEANKQDYPVLLANGNLVESGDTDDSSGTRHYAVWTDPFPKPSYLFCCVAGDLGSIKDTYTTGSGRKVTLELFSEADNVGKLDYAMDSLKRSMQWDETKYGLEYDLDLYNIVAVDSFNMGAMENKVRSECLVKDGKRWYRCNNNNQ
jgi:aminopeptidase N